MVLFQVSRQKLEVRNTVTGIEIQKMDSTNRRKAKSRKFVAATVASSNQASKLSKVHLQVGGIMVHAPSARSSACSRLGLATGQGSGGRPPGELQLELSGSSGPAR